MTKNKIYESFDQIENDLKILKLTKRISMLQLKSNVSDLKDSLSVKNILSNTFSSMGVSLLSTSKKRWFRLVVDYLLYYIFKRKG